MTPPRLLMVVNDATFFLSHRLPLALGAKESGFDVHIGTPEDDASRKIEESGLRFHRVPLTRRGTSPASEARAIAALVSLYRRLAPDIVHHVSAKPILYGGIASRVARVPAVVHAVTGLGHVFISQTAKARVLRSVVRIGYRAATAHPNCAVIFQNDDDRRTIGDAALGKARIVMIPGSGVDLSTFRPSLLPEGVPRIVLPARMLWDKGIGEFVEASRILRARKVPAIFVLAGGLDLVNPAGIPRQTLETWVADGDVEWAGLQKDMPAVFARSSVVCLPSYREGMPKALLEACAVGRPIVTTDVPGCRDVLRGGNHGVLVPVRDARALADALETLLRDRPRLVRMAKEAARVAPRFAFATVLEHTVALYRSLIESSSSG